VDLSKQIGNAQSETEAVFYMANSLIHFANYPRALILSLQNLKKLEDLKKEKQLTFTIAKKRDLLFYQTRLLVFIYSNIGDHKKQLEYVKKMQSIYYTSIARDTAVNEYVYTIFFNLGNTYSDLKMMDSSFHYLQMLYTEASKTQEPQWIALSSASLGSYYNDHNNIDSALFLFRKCIPAALKVGRTDLVVGSELNIGSLFQKMNRRDSAFFYTRQALQRLSTLNNPANLLDAYKQLSDLYKDNKQYDSAYKYSQNFVVLKDSLQDLTKISEAQNFVLNQTLLDQQVEQAKKEAVQQANTRVKMYALAAVIAFILLAAFLLMRNLRMKRAANILLTQQKEEIQNSLSALKEAQSQLIQSEKMASLGELTAGIAHEIQNPLNFVNNFSEVNKELLAEMNEEMEKGNYDEVKAIAKDITENEEKINHHGKRAGDIVKGMLQHSRSSSGQKELTDINKLTDEYLRLAYHGLRAKDPKDAAHKTFNATLKTDFDETIGNINIIPQDIGRVILNLITNAFYAVDEKKKQQSQGLPTFEKLATLYEPTVSISTKKLNNKVEIAVSDNGNGIPQNIIDKIFQPFFTTKPTGQGTGLGLSLSYDIIKAHGGNLLVESGEEGARFIIYLPYNN
jgi:signal transduction histidine kinase